MGPLVLLAASLLPDLIKIIAGDRAGTVAKAVEDAVRSVTGADDAPKAKEKLADPAVASALHARLAQIALDASRRQLEDDDQRRKDELGRLQENLKSDNESAAGARDLLVKLADAGSSLQWVPAAISFVVIVFFAVALFALVLPSKPAETPYKDLLNICIGALVAGFSTVISYWLGSSKGSRDKDVTTRAQAIQATEQARAATASAPAVTPAPQPAPVPAPAPTPAPSAAILFNECLTQVLAMEGGFSDNPKDPGGATNFGITQGTLDSWRRRKDEAPATEQDMKTLKLSEAGAIYRADYWNPLRCDALPPGVDLVVFDFGVNAGPARSAMTLQEVVGVTQDGSIGPQTLHNVPLVAPQKIVREFSDLRRNFYRSLDDFNVFGAGWLNRVNRIEEAALKMIG